MIKAFLSGLVLLSVGCTQDYTQLVREVSPTVVKIEVPSFVEVDGELEPATYTGAGVLISPYGHILTVEHLLDHGFTSLRVSFKDDIHPEQRANVLAVDKIRDVALIKIPALAWGKYKHSKLASRHSTRIGQYVVSIGHPLGFDWSVTHGIVSGMREHCAWIQNDASANPGNSGGPLFNTDGEVLGVVSHGYNLSPFPIDVGLAMSVSTDSIYEFLTPYLGLQEAL